MNGNGRATLKKIDKIMTSAMKYLMIIIIIFTQYQQYRDNRTCEKVHQLLYPSLK